MKIRPLKIKDINSVKKLYKEIDFLHYENVEKEFLHPNKILREEKFFTDITKNSESEIFVAELNKMVVGFLEVQIREKSGPVSIPKKYGYLFAMFVLPDYRRLGIAKKLIGKSSDWFKERNINETMFRVYDFNKQAIELFKKYGYKIESVLMTKNI